MSKNRFVKWETLREVLVNAQFYVELREEYKQMDQQWKLGYLQAIEDIVSCVESKKDTPFSKDMNLTGYDALVMDIKDDTGGTTNDY